MRQTLSRLFSRQLCGYTKGQEMKLDEKLNRKVREINEIRKYVVVFKAWSSGMECFQNICRIAGHTTYGDSGLYLYPPANRYRRICTDLLNSYEVACLCDLP